MNTEVIEEAEVVTPVFEPGKNYVWKPDDQFTLTGQELASIHNTLHLVFNEDVPDSKAWIMLHALYKISSELVKRGVEAGIIKEAPQS